MKTTTVLWPADLFPHDGICYGWTQPLVCVAGILAVTDRLDAENLLKAAVARPQWRGVRAMFSSDPKLLGICTAGPSGDSPRRISLFDPHLSGNLQFVQYRRHRRHSMRFYSFNFNELDILPSQEYEDRTRTNTQTRQATVTTDPARALDTVSRKYSTFNGEVLSQANMAHFLADIIEREHAIKSLPHTPPRTPDLHGRMHPLGHVNTPKVTPQFGKYLRKIYRLARMSSTTAEQFDVRYEQGVYVLGELPYVYHDKARTVQSISKYIKFHNCVWLVLNDVIIGVAFGSFMCENERLFARWLHYSMQTYLVDGMQHALLWLNSWPAGLKLNTELSQFYCHSLIGVVLVWGWLLEYATPYFPALVWMIGACGCFGMTMIVSLLSDVLSVLTAHLYVCYYISATVFRHQLRLAGSLWNLFRGKRYNVLRNRIDTWDYDLDQLLLGTILFTLLAFLYPTVLTYYALFATARLAVIVIHAIFDTVTALLNHFPLFALLLRVKDPLRLPGGVCIQPTRTGHLALTSQPASLSSIFRHYAHLAGRLMSHYHPLRMLRQLASGQLLHPIPRASIRYSMIPAEAGARPDKTGLKHA